MPVRGRRLCKIAHWRASVILRWGWCFRTDGKRDGCKRFASRARSIAELLRSRLRSEWRTWSTIANITRPRFARSTKPSGITSTGKNASGARLIARKFVGKSARSIRRIARRYFSKRARRIGAERRKRAGHGERGDEKRSLAHGHGT